MNVRMAYKSDDTTFTDLFPRSTMSAISDAGNNVLSYSTMNVTIPVPSSSETNTQIININPTGHQSTSIFYVELTSTGDQALSDYSTITQMEIQGNQLIITRLYAVPTQSINVQLIFKEGGPIDA